MFNHDGLDKLGWTGAELAGRPKGDARKRRIAPRLRNGNGGDVERDRHGVAHGPVDACRQPLAKRERENEPRD